MANQTPAWAAQLFAISTAAMTLLKCGALLSNQVASPSLP